MRHLVPLALPIRLRPPRGAVRGVLRRRGAVFGLLLLGCSDGPSGLGEPRSTTDPIAPTDLTETSETGLLTTPGDPLPWNDISIHGKHACGVDGDGQLRCWGSGEHGVTSPPAGRFTELGVGNHFACALDEEGSISCWGCEAYGFEAACGPPSGTYVALSVGGFGACALAPDGRPSCWGAPTFLSPPDVPLLEVSVGSSFWACGITHDAEVICWGEEFEQLGGDVPDGPASAVALWEFHVCILDADGLLRCVGDTPAPDGAGPFEGLEVFHDGVCAWGFDTLAQCWLEEAPGRTESWVELFHDDAPDVPVGSLDGFLYDACALTLEGEPLCWGVDEFGETQVPYP